MNGDASKIYASGSSSFKVFSKAANNTYEEAAELTSSSFFMSSDISQDETLVAITSTDGLLRIY